jgi:hypothetical protein
MQLAERPNRRPQRSANAIARRRTAVDDGVPAPLRNPLLTPRHPASDAKNCSTRNPSEMAMTTDAAGPGSQRGPDTGSIPATPFNALATVSAAAPSNAMWLRSAPGATDPPYAHTSTSTAAIATSDMSRRATPRWAKFVGRPLGHDEGIVDFRTTVGNGLAPGTEIANAAGIAVAGALAVPRPDEHDATTINNVNAPTQRRRLSTGEV